jgi:light-regulated signal transduction histidine kinase (bacteriophytochrome)
LEEISQHHDTAKLPIEELPYEEVRLEVLSMSIGAAENFVELHLNSIEEKERVLRERCNPLVFLGEIFDDPERLLDLMRCTGTIFSGSRAAEY